MAHINSPKKSFVIIPATRRGTIKTIRARSKFSRRLNTFRRLKASNPTFFRKTRIRFAKKRAVRAGRKLGTAIRRNRPFAIRTP